MLVGIKISVKNILRENKEICSEMEELKVTVTRQTNEIATLKTHLKKMDNQYQEVEKQLHATKRLVDKQQEEINELYDLQDKLEQYTRKNSLEIHGVPESAYTSTEEVVLKLAEALQVPINPVDIEISHKLNRKGNKPIIATFVSHKTKTYISSHSNNDIDFPERTTASASNKNVLWDDEENDNARKRPRRDASGIDSSCSETNVEKYAAHPSYVEFEGVFFHISEFLITSRRESVQTIMF